MKERLALTTIAGFLIGRADAIRCVASSSAAIWTGIALTLLTAFPRNYDQTYIAERPFLWFFGSLLFSLVSGTWVFLVSYGLGARHTMTDANGKRPPLWSGWPGFMGVFWMTAPVAWIYAVPVERILDGLAAARTNLVLLAIVALWRVLLMARVFQVLCKAPFARTLLWVLLAAFVEIVVITFFGSAFGKALMASMGGMRNSPEEDLLIHAMLFAATVSFWGVPVVALILGVWRWGGAAEEWPVVSRARVNWKLIAAAGAVWIAIAIPAQLELRHNHRVEQLVEAGEMRAAIDYMNTREPGDFAPARPLPPKLFEWDTVPQALRLASQVTAGDREWVRLHARHCLETAAGHLAIHYGGDRPLDKLLADEFNGFDRREFDPAVFAGLLMATNPAPEITDWLLTHTNFLSAVGETTWKRAQSDDKRRQEWQALARALDNFGITNRVYPKSPAAP